MTDTPDPIQKAIAWLREEAAIPLTNKYERQLAKEGLTRPELFTDFIRWADAIEAREAKIERLTIALNEARYRPMGDNHHNAILCPHCNPKGLRFTDPAQNEAREREIGRLREAIERMVFTPLVTDPPGDPGVILYFNRIQELGRSALSNPSADTSSADRDAAGTTTHLPASAPLLRSPASGSGTFYSEAYVFRLCAALKAARELIQKHDNWHHNVGTVLFPAEEGQIGPTWINLSAEYADATLCEDTIAVLAQIDEVMK